MKDFLKQQIKGMISDNLDIDSDEVSELADDEPLIGGSLDLDSIDALELVIQIEKRYGVKIQNSEETKEALSSIDVLADYILSRAAEAVAAEKESAES